MICGSIFDAPQLREQLAEIEKKLADPNIWDNPEKSQQLMRERKRTEESLASESELARRSGDIQTYFDLAREGEAVTDDLKKEIDGLREVVETLELGEFLAGFIDEVRGPKSIGRKREQRRTGGFSQRVNFFQHVNPSCWSWASMQRVSAGTREVGPEKCKRRAGGPDG